jgi:hypothetical protein
MHVSQGYAPRGSQAPVSLQSASFNKPIVTPHQPASLSLSHSPLQLELGEGVLGSIATQAHRLLQELDGLRRREGAG